MYDIQVILLSFLSLRFLSLLSLICLFLFLFRLFDCLAPIVRPSKCCSFFNFPNNQPQRDASNQFRENDE